MSDRGPLIAATRTLLAAISTWRGHISVLEWDGTQGFVPILRRSILCRQIDSLNVAVELVESHKGFAAVPLLRPACEELIWLRYFDRLSAGDARDLAECLISFGLLRDLEAQTGEIGEHKMVALGLSRALVMFRSKEPEFRQTLKELGARLKWPVRVNKDGNVPSAWFIAKATDSENLYRFLYHATSRYVHFSPVELCRRGWGRPGRLEISNSTYEPIWAQFALSWGTRLFGWTMLATVDALGKEGVPEPPHDALQEAFDAIAQVPLIPLVTPDEMLWSSDA